MSQVYQIRLTSSITQTMRASDKMRHRVELSDILGETEMKELLKEALRDMGWEETAEGDFTATGPNGESLVWNIESNEVTATMESEKEVAVDIAVTGSAESKADARKDAERALERRRQRAIGGIEAGEEELNQELSKALGASEASRQKMLNEVLQRVYSEALKRKAEELGSVVEIHESQNGDDYELIIKIHE